MKDNILRISIIKEFEYYISIRKYAIFDEYSLPENWKKIEDCFKYHKPIMYATYDTSVVKSITIEDALDNKIDDDNSDMIHKLHEFIYLYGKECANK